MSSIEWDDKSFTLIVAAGISLLFTPSRYGVFCIGSQASTQMAGLALAVSASPFGVLAS